MKIQTALSLGLAAFATALHPVTAGASSFEAARRVLPADPDMVFLVPDQSTLEGQWLDSPVGDFLDEDWFEDLSDAMGDDAEEIPDEFEEWLESAEGPLVFALAGIADVINGAPSPRIVIATGFDGDPGDWEIVVEEAFTEGEIALERIELDGVPAFRLVADASDPDMPRVEFGLIDGLQVFQIGGNGLNEVIDRMDGAVEGFSDDWYPSGLAVDTHLGGEMAFFFKGASLWTAIEAVIRENLGNLPDAPVDADTLIETLDLTGIRAIGMSFDFEPDFVRIESDLDYSTDGGIGGLMQFRPVQVDRLPVVPDGSLSLSRSGFDLSAMLVGIETMIGNLFPAEFAQYETQMVNFSNILGVDIRAAFLQGFGSEFLTYGMPGGADGDLEGASDTYIVMELAPGGLLEALYSSLIRNFPMATQWIETEPVGDETFNLVRLSRFMEVPEGEAGVYAWSFEDARLVFAVGTEGLHLRYPSVVEPGERGERDARVASLIDQLGVSGEPVALSYNDLEATFENVGAAMEPLLMMADPGPEANLLEFMLESMQDVSLEAVSVSWIEDGVLRSRQDFVRKSEE